MKKFTLLTLALLSACDDPEFDLDEPEAAMADEDEDEAVPEDVVPPSAEQWVADQDPQGIIGGFVIDSDRDVRVTTPRGWICTGTLLRNDVVLTAKHCITTDGTIEGPIGQAAAMLVQQDGPGATLGAARAVTTLAWMSDEDVALLQLHGGFTIEGKASGVSTQIWDGPIDELIGLATACQGYGQNVCGNGAGTLRGGLVMLDSDNDGMLRYEPIGGVSYPYVQAHGDSGSSCRAPFWEGANLRKTLGVLSTGSCPFLANETAPYLYDDWAHDQMNTWAGDFNDNFSASGNYEAVAPASMYQGPPSWSVSGGKLVESTNAYTGGTNYEGALYINEDEVMTDATVSVTVSSWDNDAAGLILRYRDPTHYYRVSFDEQRQFVRIVRRKGNVFTTLAEADLDIDWSDSPRLEVNNDSKFIVVRVDGSIVLWTTDHDFEYTAGRVGLYTWGLQDATFDDFEIDRH